MKHKGTGFLFLIYTAVLTASLAMFFSISKDSFLTYPQNREQVMEEAQKAKIDLYNAIDNGTLDDINGIYNTSSWSFEYDGSQLEIKPLAGLDTQVIVKYKEENDNIIEVEQYATKTVIAYIDLTERVKEPAGVFLDKSSLLITPPEERKITLIKFIRDFTLRQFLGSDAPEGFEDLSPILGGSVIYLKVPKGLLLTGSGFRAVNGLSQEQHEIIIN